MRKEVVAMLMLVWWSLSAVSTLAQVNCLEKLSQKVKPKSRVTIIKTDHSKISGQLSAINLEESYLTLLQGSQVTGALSKYDLSEITQIKYKRHDAVNPWIILPFMVAGFVGGYQVGSNNPVHNEKTLSGIAAGTTGMLFGLLLGAAISYPIPSSYTIDCHREPAP